MTANNDQDSLESIADELRDASIAYGGVFQGTSPVVIDCIDDAFEGNVGQTAIMTGLTSIGADLVPFVREAGAQIDTDTLERKIPALQPETAPATITEFEAAAAAVRDARVVYLVVTADGEQWRRYRRADADQFQESEVISGPLIGRYVLAKTIVDTSAERTAALADEASATVSDSVEIIDWDS